MAPARVDPSWLSAATRPLFLLFALLAGCTPKNTPERDIRFGVAIYVCVTRADGGASVVEEVLKSAPGVPLLKKGEVVKTIVTDREFLSTYKHHLVLLHPDDPDELEIFAGGRTLFPIIDGKISGYDNVTLDQFRALCRASR